MPQVMFGIRGAAVMFVLSALFAAPIAPAAAHSTIKDSHPADGATVPAGLEMLKLNFVKAVRVMLVRISRAGDAQPITTTSKMPKGFVTTLEVPVAPLMPGAYSVLWTGVAKDGHVMKKTLSFTVTKSD